MAIAIRCLSAGEADDAAPALRGLLAQLGSSSVAPDVATIAERVRDDRVRVVVAEQEGRLVGTASLMWCVTLWHGPVGHVDDVVVDTDARGQGLGRSLMEAVHAEAARLGLAHLDLTSRPSREAANALYLSLGYVRRETNVYRLRLAGASS